MILKLIQNFQSEMENKGVADVEFDSAHALGEERVSQPSAHALGEERVSKPKRPRNKRPRSPHPGGCQAIPVIPQSSDASMIPGSSSSKTLTSQTKDILTEEETDLIRKLFRRHIDESCSNKSRL